MRSSSLPHLFVLNIQQWLHGPRAEGRCPNCENACSLEGGTLSLASPALLSSSQGKRDDNLTQANTHASPLTLVQRHLNDTLTGSRDRLPQAVAAATTNSSASPPGSVAETLSTCSSFVDYSDTTVNTEESKTIGGRHHIPHTFANEGPLTSSFSPPWGVVSRLMSIMIFLMFLYKLRSLKDNPQSTLS